MNMDRKLATLALAGALAAPQAALAEDSGVYNLGEIHVIAPHDSQAAGVASNGAPAPASAGVPFQPTTTPPIVGDTISAKKFETFEKGTLDKAVELTPGVVADDLAGPRNEQNIFVHGFDRWRVPIMLDGVTIYLPADNRLDFGRFLTSNLAEVQIAKGYASVLDGPGGLGGDINLVTRKPVKEIEGEIGSAIDVGKTGYLGERSYARVGTNQGSYYVQASGAWNKAVGWDLPDSYTPNAQQGAGLRNHSATADLDFNFKAGYTPNATDEYSINFLHQEGQKGEPFSTQPAAPTTKYWSWPYWDVQTLALLTQTQIDPTLYIKTKVFWDRFDNSIDMFSNAAMTLQNTSSADYSEYHDWNAGGSIEVGKQIVPEDTLKGLLYYRHDVHNENDAYFVNPVTGKPAGCTANVVCYNAPRITSFEDTYSVALENTYHIGRSIDFVQGVSYDWRNIPQARGFNSSTAPWGMINYPDSHLQAPNGQVAVIWRYDDKNKFTVSFSDRTRFPTLFELYSTRFGTFTGNPTLAPERAANTQIGWEGLVGPRLKLSADAYFNYITDAIESVSLPSGASQDRNVGLERAIGADFKGDYGIRDDLDIGGQVSLIHRWLALSTPISPNPELTGVPGAFAFLYAVWRPLPGLSFSPNLQLATSRWSSNAANTGYVQEGGYALLNFKAEYKVTRELSVYGGAKNLLDKLYVLTDGYPEPGRTIYIGARYTF